jgi:hypothetical protein
VWVAGVGDVNRDRRPDVAVGLPSSTEDGTVGAAYVVFGKASPDQVDLATLGNGGYPIAAWGMSAEGGGPKVRGGGDVNGDGRGDLLVTTYQDVANPFESGATYVVFGKSSSDPVDVHSLGRGGFRIEGPPLDGEFDSSADGAGDVNRDGQADIVIAYPYAANSLRPGGGWSYVVFGKRSGAPVRLGALGRRGFRISGDSPMNVPFAAAGAGDFNRDRKADVVLGGQATACVVFGRRFPETVDLGRLGRQGVCFDGHRSSEAGTTVSGAGDFNRDGYADVVVGAQYDNFEPLPGGAYEPWPGAAYVVLGHRTR